jgi:hypothetical protein
LAALAGAAGRSREAVSNQKEARTEARPLEATAPQAHSDTIQRQPSWAITFVGLIALTTLTMCLLLPLWVAFSESQPYAERLANYRTWLAWLSVTHLVACAAWVMAKDR